MFKKDFRCEDAIRGAAKVLYVLNIICCILLIIIAIFLMFLTGFSEGSLLILPLGPLLMIPGYLTSIMLYSYGEHIALKREMLEEQTALRLAITNASIQSKFTYPCDYEPTSAAAAKRAKRTHQVSPMPEASALNAPQAWCCKCGAVNLPHARICSACFSPKP